MAVPANGQEWYQALTAAGFTAIGAAGVMGNIEQESGGNPEEMVAGCVGGVCWNPPSYGVSTSGATNTGVQLVTGNISQDIKTQALYIAATGGLGAVAGATDPASAASAFMNNYEKCDPALCNEANRTQSAVDSYNAAQSGNWGPGGSGASSSGSSSSSSSSSASSGGMEQWIAQIATKGPGWFNFSEAYPTTINAQGWEQENSWWDVSILGGILDLMGLGKTAGDLTTGLSDMEKAAGAAVGILAWITSPIHLIRIGEVIVGIIALSAGLILFLALLFPNLSRTLSSSAGALSMVMGPARAAKGLAS